ncbi:hypothetical protein, partial [Paracoccus ravus]|uniref:hypothetical protein n=1 Tax=Paracoccus ravus TaxID=2447760 RepID=UPI001ADCA815
LTKHSHDLRFRETALSHSNLLSSRYEKILLMQPLNHGEDYRAPYSHSSRPQRMQLQHTGSAHFDARQDNRRCGAAPQNRHPWQTCKHYQATQGGSVDHTAGHFNRNVAIPTAIPTLLSFGLANRVPSGSGSQSGAWGETHPDVGPSFCRVGAIVS